MGKKKQKIPYQSLIGRSQKGKKLKKTDKGKRFKIIYRQFVRRMFKRYKAQFPRMRESELINRVIREWEAYSEAQKLQMEKRFTETQGTNWMIESSSNSKSRSKSNSKSDSDSKLKGKLSKGKKDKVKKEEQDDEGQKPKREDSRKKPPSPKVFVEKQLNRQIPESDGSKSKKFQDSSSSPKITIQNQSKKNKKQSSAGEEQTSSWKKGTERAKSSSSKPMSEFLTFRKYYFDRLQLEHPRWSHEQIMHIIKLLWRKRGQKRRKNLSPYSIQNLTRKPKSGRVMYRIQKQKQGFARGQIKIMWKNLPYENKRYWQKKGRGGRLLNNLPNGSVKRLQDVLKRGLEQKKAIAGVEIKREIDAQEKGLKWMGKVIKNQE